MPNCLTRELLEAGKTKNIRWIGLLPISSTGTTVFYHDSCQREFTSTVAEVNSIGCRKCQEDRFDRALAGSSRFDVV